jgi:hypothetical protein
VAFVARLKCLSLRDMREGMNPTFSEMLVSRLQRSSWDSTSVTGDHSESTFSKLSRLTDQLFEDFSRRRDCEGDFSSVDDFSNIR